MSTENGSKSRVRNGSENHENESVKQKCNTSKKAGSSIAYIQESRARACFSYHTTL